MGLSASLHHAQHLDLYNYRVHVSHHERGEQSPIHPQYKSLSKYLTPVAYYLNHVLGHAMKGVWCHHTPKLPKLMARPCLSHKTVHLKIYLGSTESARSTLYLSTLAMTLYSEGSKVVVNFH